MLSGLVVGHDQSLTLGAALRSLRGVDELFYLDGGSKDNSLEIAKQYEAIILPAQETGSACRMYAAEKSKNPWLIWISPDDVLEKGAIATIKNKISKSDADVVYLNVRENSQPLSFPFPRVYKNSVKWIGRCHEYPAFSKSDSVNATVTHMRGPWHDKPSDPDAVARLLWQDINEHPEDSRWLYYYAREWLNRQQLEKAAYWFEQRVKVIGNSAEMADSYLYLARIYRDMKEHSKAYSACLSAVFINTNFKEAILFLVDLSLPHNKRQWQDMADKADNSNVLFIRTP